MRVTVRDAACNVTQGNPTRLSVTSARIGRRLRKVRTGHVKVPFGRTATLRGRSTLSAGPSFAGQTIVAASTVRRQGARPVAAGRALTDRRGRFSLQVPAGPSRAYRLVFMAPEAHSASRAASRSACRRRALFTRHELGSPAAACASVAACGPAASGSPAAASS
jgi:hypothetical protein